MREATLERVPPHLRQYVVQQNYDGYDEVDHAVWRFVMLQLYRNLKDLAHPAYVKGLEQTGIGIERIPRIEEMDACLSEFGWGAVCVDGFIPPRAFQEFQALGIMTIAADIRTPDHLAYTPAPDIIHESAGHSPIVPDPKYRHFLKRFGEIGCKAFSSPEDLRVYEAIRNLSIVKESPLSTEQEIQTAEDRLTAAVEGVTWTSETSLLSRLHWWTVEYGLVGTPTDYKIYGAGLLSSVGESFFCHQDKVQKVPLTAQCVHTSYDITKPQPQLFVVPDFDALNEILEEVADTLAFRKGGNEALDMARKSGETATVVLNSGIQISGVLDQVRFMAEQPAYLQFKGPSALAYADQMLKGHGPDFHEHGYGCALGHLADGRALSNLKASEFTSQNSLDSRLTLTYQSGVRVEGTLIEAVAGETGQLILLSFKDCKVQLEDTLLFDPSWGQYDLAIGEEARTAYAGVADPNFWPITQYRDKQVPPANQKLDAKTQALHEMYRSARDTFQQGDNECSMALFQEIHQSLQRDYPEHWLLRWNLLECLVKMQSRDPMVNTLRRELLEIESRHYEEAPISMGLRYLDAVANDG